MFRSFRMQAFLILAFAVMFAAQASSQTAPASSEPSKPKELQDLLKGMRYREVGPFRGGRSLTAVGIPGNPKVYYFGATGGGVWKSVDGANTYHPIFDHEGTGDVGSIAVAHSDPNIVYVGTGESCIRGNATIGDGVYKSLDGGKTWKNIGLKDTQAIARVIINPANPNIVFVAALGHPFGPNEERGVFRTTDGGRTWEKVLYKNPDTGAIDITFDPNNPNILFAAFWQARRTSWGLTSGGPGSGLYRSADGGTTWKQLTGHGLPGGIWGKIGVAVGANSEKVYALIEAKGKDGGLYRSDNGGDEWKQVSADRRLIQRSWYYMHIYADPKNADKIYILDVQFFRSTDGGVTFSKIRPPHGDNHGLWIDPEDTNRMIATNDGGATVTLDGGQSWTREDNQPTAQFYHVIADTRFPYYIYGSQQDNSSVAIASRGRGRSIDQTDWYAVGGGESGYIAPDPRDPDIVYAAGYEGQITVYNHKNEQEKQITIFPELSDAMGAATLKHRFQWTSPVVLSPHDPNVLYHGGEKLFRTTDAGMHWEAISPDLTRNDKSKQVPSGGPLTIDDTGTEYYDTIFAVAESPLQKGLIWVGTDDGLVQITRDDGKTWTNVTPKDLPEWSRISLIDPSPFEPGSAYMAANHYQADDQKPYIYKTTDYGKTWTKIVNGIPDSDWARAVREDPKRKGLLFAGTEFGVFFSLNDGAQWQKLQLNLPQVPIHDLIIKDNDLAVATHGRSFWILDDISPLRQWSENVGNEAAHLFTPSTAYRLQAEGFRPGGGSFAGANPPAGAVVYISAKAEPKEASIEFLDSSGKVMRRISSKDMSDVNEQPDPDDSKPRKLLDLKPGLNRFVWDLRYTAVPRMHDYYLYDYQGGTVGPKVLPGEYQVKLTVDGQSYTAPLEVKLDPNVKTSMADLQKQYDLGMQIRQELARLYTAAEQVKDLRDQAQDLRKRIVENVSLQPVATAAEALDQKLGGVQDTLINVDIRANEDSLAMLPALDAKLAYLAEMVGRGADSAPTEAEYQTFDELKKKVDATLTTFDAIVNTDIPAFQNLTSQHKLTALVVPARGETSTVKGR